MKDALEHALQLAREEVDLSGAAWSALDRECLAVNVRVWTGELSIYDAFTLKRKEAEAYAKYSAACFTLKTLEDLVKTYEGAQA